MVLSSYAGVHTNRNIRRDYVLWGGACTSAATKNGNVGPLLIVSPADKQMVNQCLGEFFPLPRGAR